MDPLDLAQTETEIQFNARIKNIRDKTKKSLLPTGVCYYCEDNVGTSLLFCSSECRDDYSKEQRMREINGLK